MRIAICEDTPMEADFLCEMLRRYQRQKPHIKLEIELYGAAEELAAALEAGQCFELYLLDIIMPGMNGMSLAQALRRQGQDCVIIFLTGSTDFAVEAFRVKASDYLLKPVQKERLFSALDDAIAALGSRVEPLFVLQTPDYDVTVKRGDIVAVEVTGHTLTYCLAGGRRLASKVLRIPFEQAAAELLADGRFFCPHRSFLINLAHVEKLDGEDVWMAGGICVPVSRLRLSALKHACAEYLARTSGA